MSELFSGAREALERAKEKAAPAVKSARDKAAAVAEDVKERAGAMAEDVKEKAAPVVEKVKGGVDSAVDAVKGGAEKIGELFKPDAPAPEIKNPLFDELEQEVRGQRDAAQTKAEEMQRRLREMMGGKREDPPEKPEEK